MKAGLPRFFFWVLALMLSIQALHHFTAVLHHPYPIEYGEGVNLHWSQQAGRGESLYPPVHENTFPQLHNPYPPLFPYTTSAFRALGANANPFSAGRHVSLCGVLLALSAIFCLIKRHTAFGTALLGTLMFILSPMILRFGLMFRVDSLALGFSLQALNFLDKQKLKSAALFAALAICIKPSFISAGITVAIVAFLSRDLKIISRTALCGVLPLLVLFAGISLQPGNHWAQHLVTLQTLPPDFHSMFIWFSRFAGQHAPLLTLGILSYRKVRGPLKIYAPLVLVPLCLTAWISGSQENYLMELWAVSCILSSRAWPTLRENYPRAAWLFLLLQLSLFVPIAPAPVYTRTYGQEIPSGQSAILTPTAEDVEIGELISAELLTFPDPVLSADLGYLFVSGHDAVYQPFQFEKLSAEGRWSSEFLHTAIKNSDFSAILLKGLAEDAADPSFTPETQQLIHQHYTLHRVLGPWHLYRRK